jgi:hypothetical protein
MKQRIEWLERQIKIQEEALIHCSREMMATHAYLLERLTNEWCELVKKGGLE